MRHNQIPPLPVWRKNAGDDVWVTLTVPFSSLLCRNPGVPEKILVTFPQENDFSLLEKSICKENDEDEHEF